MVRIQKYKKKISDLESRWKYFGKTRLLIEEILVYAHISVMYILHHTVVTVQISVSTTRFYVSPWWKLIS